MRRLLIAIVILSALALLPGGTLAQEVVGPFEGPATSGHEDDTSDQESELITTGSREAGNIPVPDLSEEQGQSIWVLLLVQPDDEFFDLLPVSKTDISPGSTYLWVINDDSFLSELVSNMVEVPDAAAEGDQSRFLIHYDGNPGLIR